MVRLKPTIYTRPSEPEMSIMIIISAKIILHQVLSFECSRFYLVNINQQYILNIFESHNIVAKMIPPTKYVAVTPRNSSGRISQQKMYHECCVVVDVGL